MKTTFWFTASTLQEAICSTSGCDKNVRKIIQKTKYEKPKPTTQQPKKPKNKKNKKKKNKDVRSLRK
jgi:hypothetical protein